MFKCTAVVRLLRCICTRLHKIVRECVYKARILTTPAFSIQRYYILFSLPLILYVYVYIHKTCSYRRHTCTNTHTYRSNIITPCLWLLIQQIWFSLPTTVVSIWRAWIHQHSFDRNKWTYKPERLKIVVCAFCFSAFVLTYFIRIFVYVYCICVRVWTNIIRTMF